MELALEIISADKTFHLIDISMIRNQAQVIRYNNLYDLIHSTFLGKHFNSLESSAGKFSHEQTVVIMYFILNNICIPELIISQYLSDVGIRNEDNEILSRKVYEIKLKLFDLHDFPDNIIPFAEKMKEDTVITGYTVIRDLNELLLYLRTNPDILWKFDSIEDQRAKQQFISLEKIKEAFFQLEDKFYIISGLAVSFSSFLVNIASSESRLLRDLSGLIQPGLRDKISLGRVISENPLFVNLLHSSGFKKIDLIGLDHSGSTVTITSGNFKWYIKNSYKVTGFIPLFIKMIK